MPWIQIRQTLGQDGAHLDYMQMLLPTVFIHSLKRRHFLVFLSTLTSIVLKVQVVLSPGFFQTATVQASRPVEVEVLNSFNIDSSTSVYEGLGIDYMAYNVAKTIQELGMEFPFGVNSDTAYQTFKLPKEYNVTDFRGTVHNPLEVLVDAISIGAECLLLETYNVSKPPMLPYNSDDEFHRWYHDIEMRVRFQTCEREITVEFQAVTMASVKYTEHKASHWLTTNIHDMNPLSRTSFSNGTSSTTSTIESNKHACASLPAPHIMSLVGLWGSSPKNATMPHLESFAATLCSIRAWKSKAKLLDDGIRPSLSPVKGPEEAININLDSNVLRMTLGEQFTYLDNQVLAEPEIQEPLLIDSLLRGEILDPTDASLYESSTLARAIHNVTERLGPLVAHQKLRQLNDVPEARHALMVVTVERLQINQRMSITMMVLFSLCWGITLCMTFQSKRALGYWHRDPATILGLMVLFSERSEICTAIKDCSSKTRARSITKWNEGDFSPMILRPWARAMFSAYVVTLIFALIQTLRHSEKSNGLAPVSEEGYSSFLWKPIAPSALLIVALYSSSVDSAIRASSALASLSSGLRDAQNIDMSLLDMIGLRTLYYSVRLQNHPVTITQTIATLCGILVTLSSTLLVSSPVPKAYSGSFRQKSWFGTRAWPESMHNADTDFQGRRAVVGGLLSMRYAANFTSPQHTFDDLLFPIFDNHVIENSPDIQDTSSVEITIASARLDSECTQLNEGRDFVIQFDGTGALLMPTGFICNNGGDPGTPLSSNFEETDHVFAREVFETDKYECEHPRTDFGDPTPMNRPWKSTTYAWGEILFDKRQPELSHLSVWRCNYSWIEASTELNLAWADGKFAIDPTRSPPKPDVSTVRPWDPPFNIPDLYNAFGHFSSGLEIDPIFMALLEPAGSLQIQDLGNANRDVQILEMLTSNTGFVAAQLANIESRLTLTEKSIFPPETRNELPSIKAKFIDEKKRRLFQDPKATYALVGILFFVALMNTWALVSTALKRWISSPKLQAWLLDLDLKGQAPSGFESVAMMESLLHCSNYARFIPGDAMYMPPKELYYYLEEARFGLRRFWDKEFESSVLTIGVTTRIKTKLPFST